MDAISQINEAVLKLWESTFSDEADVFMPLIYPALKRRALLFVGLNPSFSEKGFQVVLKDTPYSDLVPIKFFHWSNRASFDPAIAKALEISAKNKYAFFAKFRKIAQDSSVEWEHIDLFFYRETSQNQFKQRVYTNGHLSDFGKRQMELSKALIIEANPKVIVVANAFASSLLIDEFGLKFDEEHGYHILPLEGRSVPIFLASMLTGQRAMDVYSYQRLSWHIKQALQMSM